MSDDIQAKLDQEIEEYNENAKKIKEFKDQLQQAENQQNMKLGRIQLLQEMAGQTEASNGTEKAVAKT